MDPRDWALVVFTVLTQAAVGAYVTLLIVYRPAARGAEGRRTAGQDGHVGPLVAVLVVLSVGLFAALFHLATPLQAARAFVNVASSWLSREIVFGTLFAGLLAALVAAEWRAGRTTSWHRTLAGLTAAAGAAFLYCQIRIYLLPSQPAWNSAATPVAFTATALRLGTLGVAVGLVGGTGASNADARGRADEASWPTLRGLALAGILMLLVEIVVVPIQLAALGGNASPAAAASAIKLTVDYGGVWMLRLGLLVVAAAALTGVLVSHRTSGGYRRGRILTYASFGLVLVSELCGRFLFYATQVRVGI